MRNPVSDPGRYLFIHSCPGSTYEDMQALGETERKITRDTFRIKVGPDQWAWVRRELGYDRDFPISREQHVTYHRGVYRGVPAVWLQHSRIEWIFTLDGELGPSLGRSDTKNLATVHEGDYPALSMMLLNPATTVRRWGAQCRHCGKRLRIGSTGWLSDYADGWFCSRGCEGRFFRKHPVRSRWNPESTDERIRRLERAVSAGDPQAAERLWRERERAGIVRRHPDFPDLVVDDGEYVLATDEYSLGVPQRRKAALEVRDRLGGGVLREAKDTIYKKRSWRFSIEADWIFTDQVFRNIDQALRASGFNQLEALGGRDPWAMAHHASGRLLARVKGGSPGGSPEKHVTVEIGGRWPPSYWDALRAIRVERARERRNPDPQLRELERRAKTGGREDLFAYVRLLMRVGAWDVDDYAWAFWALLEGLEQAPGDHPGLALLLRGAATKESEPWELDPVSYVLLRGFRMGNRGKVEAYEPPTPSGPHSVHTPRGRRSRFYLAATPGRLVWLCEECSWESYMPPPQAHDPAGYRGRMCPRCSRPIARRRHQVSVEDEVARGAVRVPGIESVLVRMHPAPPVFRHAGTVLKTKDLPEERIPTSSMEGRSYVSARIMERTEREVSRGREKRTEVRWRNNPCPCLVVPAVAGIAAYLSGRGEQ